MSGCQPDDIYPEIAIWAAWSSSTREFTREREEDREDRSGIWLIDDRSGIWLIDRLCGSSGSRTVGGLKRRTAERLTERQTSSTTAGPSSILAMPAQSTFVVTRVI